jgi:hypothetical protein
MGTTGLRTSLIWHDEVMSDLVHEKPAKVTIGSASDATFTTPNIGTASEYTIVTPGRRGYLLTLSDQMHGTICLGGVEHDVADFVRKADEPTGFRATPIGGNDWGVINLDATGDHKLFFQFVPLEEAEWNLGHPVILAAVGGFALSVAALSGLWWWKGVPLGEAVFRAGSLSSLAIGLAAIVRWVLQQDNESRASLGFSVMLHAAILFATFQLYERSQPFEWPKQPSVTGGYLVKLDDVAPKPEAKKPTVTAQQPPGAAAPVIERPKLPPRRPFVRPSGTKVDRPTTQIAVEVPKQQETGVPKIPSTKNEPPKVGLFVHEDILHGIAGRDVGRVAKQAGGGPAGQGGPGKGPPGAGGPGTTKSIPKGNGSVGKDEKSDGPMNTGKDRDAICMGAGCGDGPGPEYLPPPKPPEDDQPTLTAKEIDDVIRRSKGVYRACYQKELNRNPQLAGDIRIHFEIQPNGRVTGQRKNGGSMTNGEVIQCVKNALGYLRFPQKGGAIVNYPFVFNPGQ